jgi:hypothetical protein
VSGAAIASDALCAVNLANTGLIARGGSAALWGFAMGICVQVPWGWYGLATGQPGFVVLSVVYAAIYGAGLRRMWRERR